MEFDLATALGIEWSDQRRAHQQSRLTTVKGLLDLRGYNLKRWSDEELMLAAELAETTTLDLSGALRRVSQAKNLICRLNKPDEFRANIEALKKEIAIASGATKMLDRLVTVIACWRKRFGK